MRAVGIDISKYQGTFEPQGNINFIIQRASYGLTKDEKFNQLLPGVKQIERRGAYHYFSTELDPIEQAEFFFRTQGGQGFKWLAVDYEKTGNTLDAQGEQALTAFWHELHSKTEKPILLYTSSYVLRDNLIAYNGEWAYGDELWIANYRDLAGEPETFGTGWLFWQHTKEGNGAEYGVGSEFVDLNVFNGTVAELDDWLNIEPVDCCEELEKRINTIATNYANSINANGSAIDVLRETLERYYQMTIDYCDRYTEMQEEIKGLTADLGILRAREIAHTREHNERMDSIVDGVVYKNHKDIEALQHELETANKYIHSRLDDLLEKYAGLEERLGLEEMITDNNYMATNELIAELQEDMNELMHSTVDELHVLAGYVDKRIKELTIPETNHSHWWQRLFGGS